MTKKGSSTKKSEGSLKSPVLEQGKISIKAKKMGSEIGEIFAGKKKKKKRTQEKNSEGTMDSPVVEQGETSVKAIKMGSEIDEIFAGKKRKRTQEENGKSAKVSSAKLKSREKVRISKDGKSIASNEIKRGDSTSRRRKRTGDGLPIYTEEELGIGKQDAGGTKLCPFDCDCCF